jgi:amidohydrolase
MTRDELNARVCAEIDRRADEVVRISDQIMRNPESGYREVKTARFVGEQLDRMGLAHRDGLALTGVKARLEGPRPGPTVCVMGELDGLPVPDHPQADPHTGAAHACGHHAQLTHLLAVATALVETEALSQLAGSVVLLAVPAEEYVDLEWRTEQARAGRLEFLSGKAELVRLGAFRDVDLAMLVHATGQAEDRQLSLRWTANGLVAKRARFLGRAAHAAAAPERAVNALNAATLALQAIHMQRETFRDEDHVRVHPILTRGGAAVNVVPADVRLETFVRGATYQAIADAEAKVDRALRAGALAVGASVEIETLPGYLPLRVDRELGELFKRNALELVGETGWAELGPIAASSHGGCRGTNHAADFWIADPEVAYLQPAKALAWTIVDLLADEAAEARRVLAAFQPRLSRDAYLAHLRGLARTERYP